MLERRSRSSQDPGRKTAPGQSSSQTGSAVAPARAPRLHPEEIYQAELSSTEIGPVTAKVMTWVFVAILWAVPLLQTGIELMQGRAPGVFGVAAPLRAAVVRAFEGRPTESWMSLKQVTARHYFKRFEEQVEAASVAKSFFQPIVQEELTARLGYGNHKSTLGRGGWLFYQPGLDYLAGPDFLSSGYLRTATKRMVDKEGEDNPNPDPRTAILRFAGDLRKLGVHLTVMPIPDKAMMQPSESTARMRLRGPEPVPNNRGYARFVSELRAQGVDIFDVAPNMLEPGRSLYLTQDTHWTPEFMEDVSRRLARHLVSAASLSAAEPDLWEARQGSVSRVGDLVDMLKLTPNQRIFAPRTVDIHEIIERRTGKMWEPDPKAEVLLLGDSFTNIFSQAAMGWGTAAGLAEQLSYALQRRIDLIAQNGAGVFGTRSELARASNAERLLAKKVVVYEFAMRDLLGQNWKPVPIAARRPPAPRAVAAPPQVRPPAAKPAERAPAVSSELIVTGRIVKTSAVPRPGSAPYADCLTFVQLQIERVESGRYGDPILLAAFWGMRDNEWLPAASYTVGSRFRLKLIPLKDADSRARSVQRADNTDDFEHQPYFVVEAAPQ